MSNEKNFPTNHNIILSIKLPLNSTIYNDSDPIANTSKQIVLLHDSQDLLNGVIEELCDLYNREIIKGNQIDSILCSIEQHLVNKKQKPEEIINLCLNNPIVQTNSIIQNILAYCYRYGKWIKNDNDQAFVHFQKSAEMGNSIGIFGRY
ncbi:hypothetical protein F8M41_016713 [Gigaspora margarita]|uniref:Uncharacterized protein n=1 Tax=Gigaspora margarita TaxID=4874 RepID=A0A8H4EMF1_GIGMA|nr:hypothetical protein F8M41_016713 [Gigaspora margarita]